ncbi:uncharacterized protein [Physcomitrium patens]|uniref:Late embryogenesis abundant protein LEA-2 subgroup domain-containing protein n=1 Tax=Physcomitrium patens TaxID=3218 RepID=A0A2K1IU22_PHYPA|nr:uncharacterized protein LOC112273656 [Physcomitrium patens]PNR32777.1 hypothetical protein PHYPA_024719 [Physcomitrium patens]|eukprot:XP_024358443.1 uncharacterized protein LOC112273656 [Physcomitrella patens]
MGAKQGFHKMAMSPEPIGAKAPQKGQFYKRKRLKICCGVCLTILVCFGIVAVALSQTIFKFRDPTVSISDIKLLNISVRFDLAALTALLSISMSADVHVNNPNHYDFRYNQITMLLVYHNDQVGLVELGAGTIASRKTVDIPAVITVEAVKLLLNGLEDVTSGVASLSLHAVIPGRMNLAHICKRNVIAVLDCTIDIFLGNQTLKQNKCDQKIKL